MLRILRALLLAALTLTLPAALATHPMQSCGGDALVVTSCSFQSTYESGRTWLITVSRDFIGELTMTHTDLLTSTVYREVYCRFVAGIWTCDSFSGVPPADGTPILVAGDVDSGVAGTWRIAY